MLDIEFLTIFLSMPFIQRVEEATEEGGGGQMHATLLSKRATTLLKVHYPNPILLDRYKDALSQIKRRH